MAHKILGQLSVNQIDDFFSGRNVANTKTYVANLSGGKLIDPTTNEFRPPIRIEPDVEPQYRQRPYHEQTTYARSYQLEEEERLRHRHETDTHFDDTASMVSGTSAGASTLLDGIETESYHGSVLTVDPNSEKRDVRLYDHYDFTPQYNDSLPITKYRDEIVNKIESNSVTILQGNTGSGKTTQVPQYILDQYAKERRWCNIIVTQPRRIAAQSISTRVCNERGWAPGSVCGYQISMDKKVSPDTRILYVTTGVLLQILANEANLHRFSHVILDEVHERDQYTDFCLLVCRKYLRDPRNSPHTKLVLMSATFDCSMFAEYFSVVIHGRLEPAPVITVEGVVFDVDEYYLEDIAALGRPPLLDAGDPHLCEEVKELIWKLVDHFDKLEIQEQGCREADGLATYRGTVLVFLPGFAEICAIQEALLPLSASKCLKILPVHSSLTLHEQIEVFKPPDARHRKVILSTNISESSITVPDIKYVIDSCLTKNLVCDEDTNYPILQMDWAAKANCIQRKGRAGRVAKGRVYRMIDMDFYNQVLLDYTIPEIRRCPLDQLVLKAKMLSEAEEKRHGSPFPPKALLALAISPPLLDDIERTVLSLKEVSALSNRVNGRPCPHDGDLTFVGRVLSRLPCDTRLGKLIIYGYVFGVLEDSVVVAAALSSRSIFANPFHEKYKAFCERMQFSGLSMSDCFAVLNAYNLWSMHRQSGYFKRQNVSEYAWCQQKFLEKRRLEEVHEMVEELKRRLSNDCGIEVPRRHHQEQRNRAQGNLQETEFKNNIILKMCLCASFYPNYFIRNPVNNEEASREMCGMDPCTTVMVRGLPADSSILYRAQLERVFRDRLPRCRRARPAEQARPMNVPQITFEGAKAYIEFESDALSTSKVAPVVLEVLNLRHHFPIRLEPIAPNVALEKMTQVHRELDRVRHRHSGLRTNRVRAVHVAGSVAPSSVETVQLPPPSTQYLYLAVRVVKDCGHFWATYGQDTTEALLAEMVADIEQHLDVHPMRLSRSAKPGTYCLAPFEGCYYRARLESTDNAQGTLMAWVFFLDYGNEESCPLQEVYVMPNSLLHTPFQAMECQLAHIKPAQVGKYEGGYTDAARDFFARNCLNRMVMAEVYSIVNSKLRVSLSIMASTDGASDQGVEININTELIRKGMAEPAEEGFLSRQNNQYRMSARNSGIRDVDAPPVTVSLSDEGLHDVTNRQRNAQKIRINGPYSPYELTWGGLTRAAKLRSVGVERDSVNNITVDDDPYDEHDRLLVAANVNMNAGRTAVRLRHTSVMPSVPGLPSLVSLLFTPYCELRTDATRSRYTGALCGLGPDVTDVAIYSDHDMEVTFDVEITDDDLHMINSLRHSISAVLNGQDNLVPMRSYPGSRNQNEIRTKLINLILKQRASVTPHIYSRQNRWGQVPGQLICKALSNDPEEEAAHILPLHDGIRLLSDEQPAPAPAPAPVEPPQERRRRLIEHLNQLRQKASRSAAPEQIHCELCDVTLDKPRSLMIHLHTREHKNKEAELID